MTRKREAKTKNYKMELVPKETKTVRGGQRPDIFEQMDGQNTMEKAKKESAGKTNKEERIKDMNNASAPASGMAFNFLQLKQAEVANNEDASI